LSEFAQRVKTPKANQREESAIMKLWGPVSALGLGAAFFVAATDQVQKTLTINYFDATHKTAVAVAPFLNIKIVKNSGISFGLLTQGGEAWRWALVALALAVVAALTLWLASMQTWLPAISVGLIIGGAIGNAADRALYGAVADFFDFHVGSFHWYVFNLADTAIVAGVAGLLYDSLKSSHKSVEDRI
jgi:signal peptidase II